MATTERPKSRLEDGRVNPEYTAWRKANKDAELRELESEADARAEQDAQEVAATSAEVAEQDFQSAAEPEQTTSDDPREPDVAPALEALSLRVVSLARNNAFVYCDLDGERVAVVVKKGIGSRLMGRSIPVAKDEESGHYIHTP